MLFQHQLVEKYHILALFMTQLHNKLLNAAEVHSASLQKYIQLFNYR